MIGATTPIFTAILALIIARRIEKVRTYMSLVPIVVGIMMSVKGEANLHYMGAIYCVVATALRAFKVVLQGILLTDVRNPCLPLQSSRWQLTILFLLVEIPSRMKKGWTR